MRSPEVDAWFAGYDNPQEDVLLFMREVILNKAWCDMRDTGGAA